MRRVVVDEFGGPEVLKVLEGEDPRPGPGEVCVRVLAAGVSFTDALVRARHLPGRAEAAVHARLRARRRGPGTRPRLLEAAAWRSRRRPHRLGWPRGAGLPPEAQAIEVPAELDPAEVVSLVFPYMTAYQLLHRAARVKSGESVLVHGAAGRVGAAVLELGALVDLRLYGTCSAADRARVEALGATAIDYRSEDFLARIRELRGEGVDVALDGIGGPLSLRSFRALRRGGRLVLFGHYSTLAHGRRSRRGWLAWYASTACAGLWGLLSPRRKVLSYRIAKLRDRHPDWFREDLGHLLELRREDKIHPVVAERLPLTEARRAHELLERSAAAGKLVLVP